jgi:hypothetical protein
MSSKENLSNPHRASTLHYDQFGRVSQIWGNEMVICGVEWLLDRVERERSGRGIRLGGPCPYEVVC